MQLWLSIKTTSISSRSGSMKSKAAFVLWAFATVSNALGLDCDHITFNYSKSRSIKFTTTPLNTCTIGQGSDSESEKLQCEASPSAPNGYEVIKYHWTEPGCSGAPANAITVDTAFDTDFNCSTDNLCSLVEIRNHWDLADPCTSDTSHDVTRGADLIVEGTCKSEQSGKEHSYVIICPSSTTEFATRTIWDNPYCNGNHVLQDQANAAGVFYCSQWIPYQQSMHSCGSTLFTYAPTLAPTPYPTSPPTNP
eukprot:211493_1